MRKNSLRKLRISKNHPGHVYNIESNDRKPQLIYVTTEDSNLKVIIDNKLNTALESCIRMVASKASQKLG